MRNWIFWGLFFLICLDSFAQKIKYYTEPEVETDSLHCTYFSKGDYQVMGWSDTVKSYYFKTKALRSKEFFNLGTRQGPAYFYYPNGRLRRRVVYRDGRISGLVNEYFANGKIKTTRFYGGANARTYHGYLIVTSWDSLGNAMVKNSNGYYKDEREEGLVKNGLPDSVWVTYDGTGKKIYEERFAFGSFVQGASFHNGQVFPYSSLVEVTAEHVGGTQALYAILAKNIEYPASASRRGIEGRTTIKFFVEPDGTASNFEIIMGFNAECDQEALRVAKLTGPWIPGTRRGLPVRQTYVLPVNFKLTK